ncbi:sensor domain-containing diguanylate cyclase [Eubacterium oxidoreducens]|uniref:GGDEF domain-containing protein, diguanylate cyclase (C-di-GMP synthetase) or its enzymatically inactive variants n=1 Tax=Eubacterium oxidoreducens TaxID=1732 RepID=A0A1G6A498_EUBOX|nr:diguanylate cyclase [Eubacterium oxidoreducens]SDB03249.1 GGDEF domain-containing protein, diguanylate cyclase (c-di-GMP synthetase) or its enzymatically inactive variants [Eubacterium oxidoreducens]
MRKNPFKRLAIVVVLVAGGLSMLAYLLWGIDNDNVQNERTLIAQMVDKSISNELESAITTVKIMNQDEVLKTLFVEESEDSKKEITEKMKNYLDSIQREFEFDSVYAVSENTKRYYTYEGLHKVIDTDGDNSDAWYVNFISSGKNYEFESSVDEANNEKNTIFIDGRVEDDEGNLLGVVGVGIEMDKIGEILTEYESQYGVRFDYITQDGLVQMSSQSKSVKVSYVSDVTMPGLADTDYHYQSYGIGGFAVIRYVPEIGWYLVARSDTAFGLNGYNYRFFFAEWVILILAVIVLIVVSKHTRVSSTVIRGNDWNVDDLTGLPNRDYFMRIYGERGTLNTRQYQTLVEFSIDDFESVEKEYEQERIILSVVHMAREIFGQDGNITRWNRSSFVVLLKNPVDEAEIMCRQYCKLIEDIGEVTVSVGLTQIKLNETLKKNYYRAAKNLYLVKEFGGNNVKRG